VVGEGGYLERGARLGWADLLGDNQTDFELRKCWCCLGVKLY
jgi:hypothetical protein